VAGRSPSIGRRAVLLAALAVLFTAVVSFAAVMVAPGAGATTLCLDQSGRLVVCPASAATGTPPTTDPVATTIAPVPTVAPPVPPEQARVARPEANSTRLALALMAGIVVVVALVYNVDGWWHRRRYHALHRSSFRR